MYHILWNSIEGLEKPCNMQAAWKDKACCVLQIHKTAWKTGQEVGHL